MQQAPKFSSGFRKTRKGRSRGKVNQSLVYGVAGLKVAEGQWKDLTARQIEAARRVMSRSMKKANGRIFIRVFPDYPRTSKPAEVRQGKGKGAVEFWAAKVKPGKILFEIDGVPKNLALEAFGLASAKLPNKTKFVTRLGS